MENNSINQEMISKLEAWLESHPEPDEKFLSCGRDSYTPRKIVEKIKKGEDPRLIELASRIRERDYQQPQKPIQQQSFYSRYIKPFFSL